MKSLRRFLLLSLSAGLLAIGALAAVAGYITSRHEVEELLDAQMTQYAHLLQSSLAVQDGNVPTRLLAPNDDGIDKETLHRWHHYENKLLFQSWHNQALLARSSLAPETPLAAPVPGFHTVHMANHDWRVFVLPGNDGHWLLVADRDDIRSELALQLALEAILPILLCIPLLLALIWVVVGYCTKRLQAMAGQLQAREADDLSPLPAGQLPLELQDLIGAINQLFARLRSIMALEKRFTADAAHELRTPITALKLHVQNALATASEEPTRQSLQRADASLQRMTHIVQQLLALNRSLAREGEIGKTVVDMAALLTAVTDEHQAQADARQQSLHCQAVPGHVQGNAELLRMLVRNLIDNALRYTPDHGRIQVSLARTDAGIVLQVEDSGPGIPAAERERVLERFYRLDGDGHGSGTDGCGLGLSIVDRICQLHGARLELGSSASLGGLQVRVHFAPTTQSG